MSVTVTEQLQNVINHLKENSTIVDVVVSEMPTDISLPPNITNPLQFVFSILNTTKNEVETATVFIPDTVYNNPVLINLPVDPFATQLQYLVTYDDEPCDVCNDACRAELKVYVDPITFEVWPLLGFDPTPVDLTTVDPELQRLVEQLKAINDVTDVVLYPVTDEHIKIKTESTQVYRCYCYYGDIREFDGRDNISIVISKETYTNEHSHQSTVDNIANLIQQKKANS